MRIRLFCITSTMNELKCYSILFGSFKRIDRLTIWMLFTHFILLLMLLWIVLRFLDGQAFKYFNLLQTLSVDGCCEANICFICIVFVRVVVVFNFGIYLFIYTYIFHSIEGATLMTFYFWLVLSTFVYTNFLFFFSLFRNSLFINRNKFDKMWNESSRMFSSHKNKNNKMKVLSKRVLFYAYWSRQSFKFHFTFFVCSSSIFGWCHSDWINGHKIIQIQFRTNGHMAYCYAAIAFKLDWRI